MIPSHLVLAGVLVAVVVLCVSLWVNKGPLWRLVMLKKIPMHEGQFGSGDGHPSRGWVMVIRGRKRSQYQCFAYFVENGFKSLETKPGNLLIETHWKFDGTISYQQRIVDKPLDQLPPPVLRNHRGQAAQAAGRTTLKMIEIKNSPPWWWPVDDQTEPTAPWWNEKDQ